MIKNGYPKETINTIDTLLVPVDLATSIIVGKFLLKSGTEFSVWKYFYILRIIVCILLYLIYCLYPYWMENDGENKIFYSILFVRGLKLISGITIFITTLGFNIRISDISIGASYLTLVNSISNFGGTFCS